MTDAPRLRLLQGGRSGPAPLTVGGVIVELASASSLANAPPPDARVLEEDTYLVLSASAEVREVQEHPIRTFTAVWEQEPEAPGSLVEAGGSPPRWLAVVHELAREPSVDQRWVTAALDRALDLADARGLRTLGLDLLGGMHGALSLELALGLLRQALLDRRTRKDAADPPGSLARVILQLPDRAGPDQDARARAEALLLAWADDSSQS